MNNARTGKIARLPDSLREQLNIRLRDGEPASTILPWLNSTGEAKDLLQRHFNGQEITEANLSNWRQGGFTDWNMAQKAKAFLSRFLDANDLNQDLFHLDIPELLSRW